MKRIFFLMLFFAPLALFGQIANIEGLLYSATGYSYDSVVNKGVKYMTSKIGYQTYPYESIYQYAPYRTNASDSMYMTVTLQESFHPSDTTYTSVQGRTASIRLASGTKGATAGDGWFRDTVNGYNQRIKFKSSCLSCTNYLKVYEIHRPFINPPGLKGNNFQATKFTDGTTLADTGATTKYITIYKGLQGRYNFTVQVNFTKTAGTIAGATVTLQESATSAGTLWSTSPCSAAQSLTDVAIQTMTFTGSNYGDAMRLKIVFGGANTNLVTVSAFASFKPDYSRGVPTLTLAP